MKMLNKIAEKLVDDAFDKLDSVRQIKALNNKISELERIIEGLENTVVEIDTERKRLFDELNKRGEG